MASTEIEILGSGRFAGSAANVSTYQANESTTTLNLQDLRGGVGSIEFTVVEDPSRSGTVLLSGEPFRLSDPYSGALNGVMDEITVVDQAGVNVTGSTHLLPLVAERVASAYSGTLGGALIYYMSLCGVSTGIQIDPILASIPVNLPSWSGEVWQQLKKLCAIYQFEIAAVGAAIIVRQPRLRNMDVLTFSSIRTTNGGSQAAREVQVHNYNTEWMDDVQVYPKPETSIVDRSIISVGASETSVTNFPVDMWIGTVHQPTHVLVLPWDYESTTSVYSVVDKDGAAVTPGDWANGGGLVSYAIGADGRSVDVTVRGMATDARAPYRIASSSQDLEYQFSALYVAADGVTFRDEIISSRTGADEQYLPVDSIVEIDDPMVGTVEAAATVLANAVTNLTGESQTFEATTTRVNRRGETGEIVYPTFAEFDADWPTQTFADFDTWAGAMTFQQFDEYQASLVADDFESQAFGGIAGARFRYRDAMYRVLDANSSPARYQWTAARDTTFQDFEDAIAEWNPTFGDFDDFWGDDITFGQFGRQPLGAPLL